MAEKTIQIPDGRTVCLFNSGIFRGREVFGCLTPEDVTFLESTVIELMAKVKRPLQILEIGTLEGLSAFTMWKASEYSARIYCIDDYKVIWSRMCRDTFLTSVEETGAQDHIILLNGDSKYVTPVLRPNAFDFVFIDGDHSYSAVEFDIQNTLSLVCSGGVIAGHDYCDNTVHGRVLIQAVEDVLGHVDTVGMCWYKPVL